MHVQVETGDVSSIACSHVRMLMRAHDDDDGAEVFVQQPADRWRQIMEGSLLKGDCKKLTTAF
jgi:hypothetical protein